MTVNELRNALLTIISEYFSDSDTVVVWSKQTKLVKNVNTFITLELSNLQGELHYVKVIKDDGPVGYQATQMRLTVQLFTHGGTEIVEDDDGTTYEIPVDTALNDIMDLDKYLASEYVLYKCDNYDISIIRDGMARNLSEVVDVVYEYRAMQEYVVSFTQTTEGLAGIKRTDWESTASGGGTSELAEKEVGYIDADKVDISKNFI